MENMGYHGNSHRDWELLLLSQYCGS